MEEMFSRRLPLVRSFSGEVCLRAQSQKTNRKLGAQCSQAFLWYAQAPFRLKTYSEGSYLQRGVVSDWRFWLAVISD